LQITDIDSKPLKLIMKTMFNKRNISSEPGFTRKGLRVGCGESQIQVRQ